ncbi:unnamed protein product [Brassica oleracea var. botrytis]|uniref:Uncharacterized protein n=1 Tax=Brassica oleracea TaxID=3712 RepID=A0A3P6DI13_BRAOL|nr:unnamed protein product [Brassica oleracea]
MDPKLLFCLPQGDELFNPLNTLFIQMVAFSSSLNYFTSCSNHVVKLLPSPRFSLLLY